jgi:RNA polymerase sigma factor (sigma-70 family)
MRKSSVMKRTSGEPSGTRAIRSCAGASSGRKSRTRRRFSSRSPAVRPDVRLLLEDALRDLPPEQREVVHLHVFEGLTFKEIASEAGASINTVAARYRYALARMRTALSQKD